MSQLIPVQGKNGAAVFFLPTARATLPCMIMHRTTYRFALWLAALAMLFAVLAPTVSRIRSTGDWVEICSVAGNKLVLVASAGNTVSDGGQPAGARAAMDCPYCALHIDLAVPTAPQASLTHRISRLAFVPRLFLQAPQAPFVWAPAQSRAPPVLA